MVLYLFIGLIVLGLVVYVVSSLIEYSKVKIGDARFSKLINLHLL